MGWDAVEVGLDAVENDDSGGVHLIVQWLSTPFRRDSGLGEQLVWGIGSFGKVYRGTSKDTNNI